MKRLLVALLFLAALVPGTASAHPLGNFTINHYSRVEVSGDRAYVFYVLDMAEIPTFQERQKIGNEAVHEATLARRVADELDLSAGGRRVALRPLAHALAFPPGAGGLRTTRFEASYVGRLPAGRRAALTFQDETYPGRIGWKEIVVRGVHGARVVASTAPAHSISHELLAYPKDLLQSPPDVTSARARVVTGSTAGPPPHLLSREELGRRVAVSNRTADGGFTSLIAKDHISAGFLLLSLLIALFWGAAHALSPGHGKALVAAYLVGSRGTPRHAFLLGGIVTVTHTAGVFALGLVTLALSEFLVPDQLYPWLNLVSALMVVAVGLGVLRWRLADWRHARAHAHRHRHHHHHDHDHAPRGEGLRSLVGAGVSAGIIPCPTALVVLLAAISLHRIGYGLVLIVAFSLGLAATISGIGLVAVSAKRVFSRVSFHGPLLRLLPAVSALAVLGLGIAMTVRAVPGVH